jgi:hypothetical protein
MPFAWKNGVVPETLSDARVDLQVVVSPFFKKSVGSILLVLFSSFKERVLLFFSSNRGVEEEKRTPPSTSGEFGFQFPSNLDPGEQN